MIKKLFLKCKLVITSVFFDILTSSLGNIIVLISEFRTKSKKSVRINAVISETIKATTLGLVMQIPEIAAQRKFVSPRQL